MPTFMVRRTDYYCSLIDAPSKKALQKILDSEQGAEFTQIDESLDWEYSEYAVTDEESS